MTEQDKATRIGVHASHCCLRHGCKYSHKDCPVQWGTVKQMYRCEFCDDEWQDAGMPLCGIVECSDKGYWKWSATVDEGLLPYETLVYLFLCDRHDEGLRSGHSTMVANEKRVL